MELFNISVSKWSVNLESYFGDIYLNHRTWITVLVIVVVLRIAKKIRKVVAK
jgi:hypothetical protein